MEPILLIHGYGGESRGKTPDAIAGIYGRLPQALRDAYGSDAVVEIDVSRYVSLEDGVNLDDISRGLDRALQHDAPHLLNGRFHVIIHSTGALVVRNWIRRFSPTPSPIGNFIHLAGANFGSGWAHIGRAQMAKWGRLVFAPGTERGVQVLDALELGSGATLDLHVDLLLPGTSIAHDYKVYEYVICGSQADASWFMAPIRYAKEDGSDGVVRASASNVNFNYVRFGPTEDALALDWAQIERYWKGNLRQKATGSYYEIKQASRPGVDGRPEVPFAIPFECAHSGDSLGIVSGTQPADQVFRLIRMALETRPQQWHLRVDAFREETERTYRNAAQLKPTRRLLRRVTNPHAQYDPHAQVIVRIRDQDGRPVRHYDVFFDALETGGTPIRTLMQDTHVTKVSPGVIVFYLRTDVFSKSHGGWQPRVPEIGGVDLQVTAIEPETGDILYLPLRFGFDRTQLADWIQPHRTTLIDVELQRLPSPEIFRVARF